jgi:RNA polymerase sigma-32 factor
MDQSMSSRDVSVDTPIGSGEESTMLDLLSSEGTPEDQVVDAHYQKVVAEKMREFGETLTGKDRTIFEKRLLTEEPMTLQEIGEMYDISRERVRQIEERLKKRLKQYLLTDMRDLETVEVVNPSSRRRKRKGEAVPDAD